MNHPLRRPALAVAFGLATLGPGCAYHPVDGETGRDYRRPPPSWPFWRDDYFYYDDRHRRFDHRPRADRGYRRPPPRRSGPSIKDRD